MAQSSCHIEGTIQIPHPLHGDKSIYRVEVCYLWVLETKQVMVKWSFQELQRNAKTIIKNQQ